MVGGLNGECEVNENVYSSVGGGAGLILGAVILLIKSFRMFTPLQFD